MVPRAEEEGPPVGNYINAVYYPSWRIYKSCPPSSIAAELVTHVFYAFARVGSDGRVHLLDDWADAKIAVDGTHGCLPATTQLRRRNSHLKIILSVGGASGSSQFPAVAANIESRQKFASSAKTLVDQFGLDGLDVDWEHPQTPLQGSHFLQLLSAIRTCLPKERYILTTALPTGNYCLRNLDLPAIVQILDFVNIMAYDFAGPWTPHAGHHAQLYAPATASTDAGLKSCHAGVQNFVSRGVPPTQIVLGVPAYARVFKAAKAPGDTFLPPENEEDATVEYKSLLQKGIYEQVDEHVVAAFCIHTDTGFASFDNAMTVHLKAKYVMQRGLGGMFFWTGTADAHGERSLVKSGYDTLNR